jgi:hypothetical protein
LRFIAEQLAIATIRHKILRLYTASMLDYLGQHSAHFQLLLNQTASRWVFYSNLCAAYLD